MIPENSIRVYLALGSTDMRKAINGLSVLVEQAMGLERKAGSEQRTFQPLAAADADPPVIERGAIAA